MSTATGVSLNGARSDHHARAAVLGALGVVFGDIGTSPLYALKEAAHAASHGSLTPETVLGVLSLILWSLIVVISIKYCIFILQADNRGEGVSLPCSRCWASVALPLDPGACTSWLWA